MIRLILLGLVRQTPAFVTAVAVSAYFCPAAFGWVRGTTQTLILGLIMLTMGLTLTTDDFKALGKRPLDLAIGSAAQFLIMPLVALGLVKGLGLPKEIAVGLILVGCSPGGVSSNLMSFLCKGDVAYSVGMTTVSTLFAPILTPVLMLVLAGETVDVDAIGMFKSILFVTILPIAVGTAANAVFGHREGFRRVKEQLPGIAVIALACIVGGVVSAQGAAIAKSGAIIFLAVLLHNALGYVLGYLTAVGVRFPDAKRRTLSIEVGMQNAGLATVLATRHFPSMPEAAIASAVSCVWHSVSGALMAGLFNVLNRRTLTDERNF